MNTTPLVKRSFFSSWRNLFYPPAVEPATPGQAVALWPPAADALTLSKKEWKQLNGIVSKLTGWSLEFFPSVTGNLLMSAVKTQSHTSQPYIEGRIIQPQFSTHPAGYFTLIPDRPCKRTLVLTFEWHAYTREPSLPVYLLQTLENQVRHGGETLLYGSIDVLAQADVLQGALAKLQYHYDIQPVPAGFRVNFEKKFPS